MSENALRSVPGVMYWAAWQEQVGPHALRHAISAYVDAHNDEGKPFKWTKTADEILAKVKRFGQRTVQVHGWPQMTNDFLKKSKIKGTRSLRRGTIFGTIGHYLSWLLTS